MLKPTLIGSAARAAPDAKAKNNNISAIDAMDRASSALNISLLPVFAS
jgi:hypothetical protein